MQFAMQINGRTKCIILFQWARWNIGSTKKYAIKIAGNIHRSIDLLSLSGLEVWCVKGDLISRRLIQIAFGFLFNTKIRRIVGDAFVRRSHIFVLHPLINVNKIHLFESRTPQIKSMLIP